MPSSPSRTRKKTIAVDFDGVINSYASGWSGGALPDPPVPGAFSFLATAVSRFTVVIHSTRAETAEGKVGMWDWFTRHGLPDHVREALSITHEKPKAIVYLDDRGWQFDGHFPTLDELDAYEPWNKRSELSPEQRALQAIGLHQAAKYLFDNRLGHAEGHTPYAPRKFWADLGAALYGEDDPRVKQLRADRW